MDTHEFPSDESQDRALFRRLTDGELTPDEFDALQHRLLHNAELRARYVRFMDLEANLYEALEPDIAPQIAPAPPRRTRRVSPRIIAAAACATIVAAACSAYLVWSSRQADLTPTSKLMTQFNESQLRGLRDAAIITQIDGVSIGEGPAALRPGMRLKPGVLAIGEGKLQLEFLKGAQVVLVGPAELHILSSEAATLTAGRAAARIPESARGFVLNSPDAAIVDLGTEFAVSVDEQGQSEVHVVEGEVEVSLLGDDGNTLLSERLYTAGTLRVRSDLAELKPVERPSVEFPTVEPRVAPPLVVSPEYVRDVLDAQPLIYWRFESLTDDGVVLNEAGEEWPARLHGDPRDPPLMEVTDGVLRCSGGNSVRYAGPDVGIPGLNADSFSVEFWVNPDHLHYATLVGVIPEGDAWESYHLNVIELAYNTTQVHDPGSFRFLHRHPPNVRGGVNLFTPAGCTPGQWHHLVTVKTPQELNIYLNGQLVRHLETKAGSDNIAYRLLLGTLKPTLTERQLVGSLDEFALYLRPLSAEEVSRHYQLLMGERTEL
jgi:hypothetical protein